MSLPPWRWVLIIGYMCYFVGLRKASGVVPVILIITEVIETISHLHSQPSGQRTVIHPWRRQLCASLNILVSLMLVCEHKDICAPTSVQLLQGLMYPRLASHLSPVSDLPEIWGYCPVLWCPVYNKNYKRPQLNLLHRKLTMFPCLTRVNIHNVWVNLLKWVRLHFTFTCQL